MNRFTRSLAIALLAGIPVLASAQTTQPAAKAAAQSSQPKSSSHTRTTGAATPSVPRSWKQVPIPALHPFQPQEPRRIELSNGLVIFLQEDHELPLINGVLRIRGGSRDEPAAKTGMNDIYAEVWRTGGTTSKTGDQLDDFLESRAATVETFPSQDSSFVSWSSLKGDFDRVFPVITDLLEHPEFRQDKLNLAKKQMASGISRRNDDVEDITHRETNKLAYGADSPYARTPEYSTVAAITREDLLDWHRRTVVPNNMILGVSGDFDSASMEHKLREAFSALTKGKAFAPAKIAVRDPAPGIYFIEKSDVNQSSINMVEMGTDRHNPDYYAINVMNQLFGGGFSSRLFSSIRTRLGLAYSVGGGVGTAFDHPGIVEIGMGTQSSNTAKAIDALNREIERITKGGVTAAELKTAKDAMLNSYIFEFDSKDKVMAERIRYEFYGYPPDFLERYRVGIEKVTAADVDRVAKKYLHPEKMAVLVVGHAQDFDRQLSTLGKVTAVDIAIPQAVGP